MVTIADVVGSLNDSQREEFYYLVGRCIETGGDPRTMENARYRCLVKGSNGNPKLTDIQKTVVDMVIGSALKEKGE